MKAIKKLEKGSKESRSVLFKPILSILTKLGINSNHISFLGLIFSFIMFYFLIKNQVINSLIFFILILLVDGIDGSLARYQEKTTDKGKFFDMVVDSIVATLLVLGLMILDQINYLNGALFIYLMLLAIIFAIMINSKHYKTDWLFHARAGFFAHLPKNIFYVFFVLWVLGIANFINSWVIVSNIFLAVLCLVYFFIIWRKY